ncbi:hypothetical protein BN2475_190239 [Paraburkholderia ribeironis]|uniref:Uncharacterized protein n=1 Tax=Paraburkholderia ribeironis TaxID=1247936 RepID=A0A1N7RWA5_9BURK|nr:hypothetical protein BN2475_190239 [Paraburkholderia ribeironis]
MQCGWSEGFIKAIRCYRVLLFGAIARFVAASAGISVTVM